MLSPPFFFTTVIAFVLTVSCCIYPENYRPTLNITVMSAASGRPVSDATVRILTIRSTNWIGLTPEMFSANMADIEETRLQTNTKGQVNVESIWGAAVCVMAADGCCTKGFSCIQVFHPGYASYDPCTLLDCSATITSPCQRQLEFPPENTPGQTGRSHRWLWFQIHR